MAHVPLQFREPNDDSKFGKIWPQTPTVAKQIFQPPDEYRYTPKVRSFNPKYNVPTMSVKEIKNWDVDPDMIAKDLGLR